MSGFVLGAFEVLRVEHNPVQIPTPPTARHDPTAMVIVRHIRDFED
jgi:hypothetical protein